MWGSTFYASNSVLNLLTSSPSLQQKIPLPFQLNSTVWIRTSKQATYQIFIWSCFLVFSLQAGQAWVFHPTFSLKFCCVCVWVPYECKVNIYLSVSCAFVLKWNGWCSCWPFCSLFNSHNYTYKVRVRYKLVWAWSHGHDSGYILQKQKKSRCLHCTFL